ncbi:hypothetical protein OU789_10355 [Halocynthiibacter sp. C4]|uniref:hypothetical protein n=1 Tax=Halocynthiibacter sp. C4 TaxID=2992758 RepID=UPI00237BACA3|nr:hypothetical protein [Halocynthiibacter sp. C4]MDE0590327.1 hypothetical protein [Halocynthiibacter sp. C4]
MRKSIVCFATILALAGCVTTASEEGAGGDGVKTIAEAGIDPSAPHTALIASPPKTKDLKFGEVVKDCTISSSKLGKKIEGYPQKRPVVYLYDSNPKSYAPHAFYLKGFQDGCVRKFVASMAMLGDLELHEALRYTVDAKTMPYSDTDKEYERLKGRICGKKSGEPCGERRMKSFAKTTAFLTIYESFGNSNKYAEVLVYKGKVVASDLTNLR